jgi:hypothetical protein
MHDPARLRIEAGDNLDPNSGFGVGAAWVFARLLTNRVDLRTETRQRARASSSAWCARASPASPTWASPRK